MASRVLQRLQLGQPLLRQKSRRLTNSEILDSETQSLIKSMHYTLRQTGGIGLAAPQIGESIQLCVINVAPENKYHLNSADAPKKRDRFVMINPRIITSSKEVRTIHEGCLSFVDLFGEVERPSQVTVEYHDENAQLCNRELSGLVATVFQHEYDHLQGVLWVDKATDTRTFMTRSEYKRMKLLKQAKE